MQAHTTPPVPATRPFFRPWSIAAGLWLSLAVVAALALWKLRDDAIERQSRELISLSMALTDEIDRGLRGAEEGLHALRAELKGGHLALTGDGATQALHTRARLMPLLQSLWLVDREGRVLAASDTSAAPDLSTFAPPLDASGPDIVAVARPFPAAAAHASAPRVALALRFADVPGQPDGWLLAALPASALLGAFMAASPAADARMVVFRSDGVRLAAANVPAPANDEATVARGLASRPTIEVRRFADGTQRLAALHGVPRYGIKVSVSRDLGAVLRAWRQAAGVAATAMALLLLVMTAAVWLVQRADRRRSEAQSALQAQRSRASQLESLGTLAGGVAHDFNNVLAGIVGFGEMAQDAAPPGSDQARHLGKVLQAAMRGKALAERILAFSRGGARESTVFELAPVVEEVLTLLSASLRPGLVLERTLQAPGACLRGDPTQAFEAVMNLCTNAMQAMPDGGLLSVHVALQNVPRARVLSHTPLAAGDYVTVAVTDQGCGITPQVMDHLFEPFFTTNGARSGTGLGLAVVFGVVAEFGGAIDVRSTPGQGACFTLYLPRCSERLALEPPHGQSQPVGAGQRLLVVDDDADLVHVTSDMLGGLGYEPAGFTDAAAALSALQRDPQAYAAVITDEVMPHMTGTALTQALRSFAPQLPVLLISGYGGALLAQRAAAVGVTRVLTKPLRRADLARALAEVLD